VLYSSEKLSEVYQGKLEFCKPNGNGNPQMATKCRVMSISLLLLLRYGQNFDESPGAVPESMIRPTVEVLG
jgi:thioredoxin-like negative regulator of GroEL